MAASAADDPLYLHVRVVEARNVPAADANGLSDPYVKVKLNNAHKKKSKVCERTLNPQFNFDASFELNDKSIDHELSFELFDHDKLTANDFLGQFKFSVSEILQHRVVAGYFDLLNKNFEAKVGGDCYVVIVVGDKCKDDSRTALLNGVAAQMAMKVLAASKKAHSRRASGEMRHGHH